MSRELFLRRNRTLVGRKSSPERLQKLLASIRKLPVIAEGCRQAGFSRSSLEYYLAKSEAGQPGDGFDLPLDTGEVDDEGNLVTERFHKAYADAKKDGIEVTEAAAFKHANGREVILTYRGRVMYKIDPLALRLGLLPGDPGYYLEDETGKPIPETVVEHDEEMIRYLLKAHNPEVYGDKSQIDVRHSGGVLVVTDKAPMALEKFEQKFGGKQEIQDVEFEEIDPDDPAA